MSDDIREQTICGLTVRILRDQCIGTAACRNAAPEVFEMDDEHVIAFTEEIGATTPERVLDACRVCPVDALEVEGEDGEKLV